MNIIKKFWFVIILILVFLLTYDPIERMWKLKPWQKENRLKHLANIEDIVSHCQRLTDSYVSNENMFWSEELEYYELWQDKSSGVQLVSTRASPVIRVKSRNPENADSRYTCETNIGYNTLEFRLYESLYIMDWGTLEFTLCSDRPFDTEYERC